MNPSTEVEISIANFTVVHGYMAPTGGRPLPTLWSIPFSSDPSGSVSQHGALITDGRASEVREYDLEGRLCRIFRVDEAGRPVTGEMIEAMIDLATDADPTSTRRSGSSAR